jgi:hypothetical protein
MMLFGGNTKMTTRHGIASGDSQDMQDMQDELLRIARAITQTERQNAQSLLRQVNDMMKYDVDDDSKSAVASQCMRDEARNRSDLRELKILAFEKMSSMLLDRESRP